MVFTEEDKGGALLRSHQKQKITLESLIKINAKQKVGYWLRNQIIRSWRNGGIVGRVFAVTSSNSIENGIRKKTIGREITIGPTAIKFITIAIFAILAMVYLAQSTAGANRSVKLRDLEEKSAQLQLEKERLEVEQTRLKALKEIDNGTEKTVMEPITTVEQVSN